MRTRSRGTQTNECQESGLVIRKFRSKATNPNIEICERTRMGKSQMCMCYQMRWRWQVPAQSFRRPFTRHVSACFGAHTRALFSSRFVMSRGLYQHTHHSGLLKMLPSHHVFKSIFCLKNDHKPVCECSCSGSWNPEKVFHSPSTQGGLVSLEELY